jgi:phospholipase/carboxylesterase
MLRGMGAFLAAACAPTSEPPSMSAAITAAPRPAPGRLTARPVAGASTARAGLTPLGLTAERDGTLYIPEGLDAPAPLILAFHGAGGASRTALRRLRPHADEVGFALLAVDSRSATWDGVMGRFGPDVEFIDAALHFTFERVAVDPDRIAVEGFSDGASYALGLGLGNGDLFNAVVAMSPGFVPRHDPVGRPRVFVAHGTRDGVLPIDRTSRLLVPELRDDGYDVSYQEFEGKHDVLPPVVADAVDWLDW